MSPLDVPEEGEYIIGRVIEVKDFGANLDLLEFPEHRAFVHISEVLQGGSSIFGILFVKVRWSWLELLR